MIKAVFPFLKDCTDYQGNCQTTCDAGTHQSLESCKEKNKICCLPDEGDAQTGPGVDACVGQSDGAKCGEGMVCQNNPAVGLTCVSLCDYCAGANSGANVCQNIQTWDANHAILKNVKIQGGWTCGCSSETCKRITPDTGTQADCIIQSSAGAKFCPITNSQQYCCLPPIK